MSALEEVLRTAAVWVVIIGGVPILCWLKDKAVELWEGFLLGEYFPTAPYERRKHHADHRNH